MADEFPNNEGLEYFCKKIWASFIGALFAGMFLSLLLNKKTINNEKISVNYPNTYRTFKDWTRKMIIDLGRKSIRDEKTGKIFTNPMLLPNGNSVEMDDFTNHGYKNLALRNYIDKLKQKSVPKENQTD